MDRFQARARTLSCPGSAHGREQSPASCYRRASYCETPSLPSRKRSNTLNGELPWHTLEVNQHGALAKLKRDIQRLHQGTDILRYSPEIFSSLETQQRAKVMHRGCSPSITCSSEIQTSHDINQNSRCQHDLKCISLEGRHSLEEHIKG